MSLLSAPRFHDDTAAREYLESIVWANGVFCPHCGNADDKRIGTLTGATIRPGVRKCYACRKQFTVTVGTVFESSHVPLHKWMQAAYLLSSSKKGFSAHQLHRTLGVTYKTAWFMAHRLREAMRDGKLPPLGGEGKIVEVDETYIGQRKDRKKARGTAHKHTVLALVERGGKARTIHVDWLDKNTLKPLLYRNALHASRLMTDESSLYFEIGREYASHESVNHAAGEYVRGDAGTNTIEGYFSIFKRGMKGVYQHCGEQHLQRYLTEYEFRYNNRIALGVNDSGRTVEALRGIVGKRLTYRASIS